MSIFKLLHISDLHFCIEPRRKNFLSLYSRRPSEYVDTFRSTSKYGINSLTKPASYEDTRIDALSEFFYKRGQSYAAVLISGDLATSGMALDLESAHSYISRAPTDIWLNQSKPQLNSHSKPIILIPGNHDHYKTDSFNPDHSSTNFSLIFEKYLKNYRNRVGHHVLIKDKFALSIVYADFSFDDKPASWNVVRNYGGGRVSQETLDELKSRTHMLSTTEYLEDFDNKIIWMIHFAPYSCGYDLELTDHPAVLDAAKNSKVNTILCGHTHKKKFYQEDNVNVYCAGSASSVECVNTIHDFYVDVANDSISVIDYEWSKDNGEFLERK